jgi:hypothetical protein
VTKQKTVGALRVAFGLLGLVALAVGYDRDIRTGDAVNFFFYFTDLSNLFAAFVLVIGGIAAVRGRAGVPDLVRGAAVLYLVITGLVYWTLLANTINAETIKWQNDVVHGVMPAVLVLDWLISPPKARLSLGRAAGWLAFPILYLAVSLIRGPIVRWWPYDFLDPTQPGGYPHVATWSVIVTGVFVLFMLLIVFVGNRLQPRSSSSGSPSSERSFSTRSA